MRTVLAATFIKSDLTTDLITLKSIYIVQYFIRFYESYRFLN